MTTPFKLSLVSLAVLATTVSPLTMAEEAEKDTSNTAAEELIERVRIIGHGNKLRTEAGSATLIGEVELEKFKFDDINRVLYNVPGVNIREEDGYGLRPNIGFRGATPERSKKITVMEDGVLIGPAPYSAPAAYYFPMMSKMTALEVSKGPAAIKYGPNTVAGALNLTTRAVPEDSEGLVEVAAGTDGFAKAKAYYGNTNGNFGYLIEAAHLRADGFKSLDGGGDTGFDKNDIMAKFQYDFSNNGLQQLLELKVSYADESSQETYLGLTDEDFASSPNRRYVASQNDEMNWEHQTVQLTHFISTENFDVTTRLYRHDFERSWDKINGFKGGLVNRDLQEILANPDDEVNQQFYQVLTGQRDSLQEYEKIILGDNAREYYSQGFQSELQTDFNWLGLSHSIATGVRFHQDQILRRHTEDTYDMRSAMLVSDGSDTVATTTNLEETDALSVFIQDTLDFGQLDVTLGVRGEYFDSLYQNQKPGKSEDWLEKSNSIWLPSFSTFYTLTDEVGFLFGIHEGFVPTSPQESPNIDIENSVNYELGGRYNDGTTSIDLVAFFNDIGNMKESCTFSAAASCGESLDEEFNGGEVDVIGVEFSIAHTFSLESGLDVPMSLTYTFTDSEFKSDFESDFPMWGTITAGDELPYLPENQASFSIGLVGNAWEVNLVARYIDEMLEASGDDVVLSDVTTAAYAVVDMSASYDFDDYGRVYLKVDNITDEQEIISRRPYGARPSKPQQVQIGYQYSF